MSNSMSKNLLAVNAGSSTLKFAFYEIQSGGVIDSADQTIHRYTVNFLDDHIEIKAKSSTVKDSVILENPADYDQRYELAFKAVLGKLPDHLDMVVHRVVHGGDTFDEHQLVTPDVICELEKLIPFAPLHQPFNLKLIKLTAELLPNTKQVACFDTQFHRSIPEIHRRYALPESCYENGEKVYGYHGLSYEYISAYFARTYPQFANDNILIAHLGSGASLCGIKQGQSYVTSMGFSTLDGLPMSSRCGQIDSGLILYWLSRGDTFKQIEKRLYKESGLLGLSGISSDFRVVSEMASKAEDDSESAKLALSVYTARMNQQLGSAIAALGGIKHLIFTAGIGENAADFRSDLIEKLSQWLPLELDEAANQSNSECISTLDSQIQLWVIPTNEEQVMVEHGLRQLEPS